MADKTVSVTIDGQTVEVPEGMRLIEAAKKVGVEIPHYCYHRHLSSPAVCRMCLVDVEGARKLQPSCNMTVSDGLVVNTQSEKVKEAVQEVLEFTLINHPLDCPICDQAGECGLQDYYQEYGLYNSRFTLPKVHKPKRQDIGPTLMLDSERCILCSRCVRFCEEVTETNEMAILQRGDHSTISAIQSVENDYSTNLADICPVGALTQKDFRFKVRVWYLQDTPSVCPGCSRGCNIHIDHHRGRLQRIRPRDNDAVNQSWMCDHGRLLYKDVEVFERLKTPLVRRNGELKEVTWTEAVRATLEALKNSGEMTVAQTSAHASNEDCFVLSELLRLLGAHKAARPLPGEEGWENDNLLKREDRTPNQWGASVFADELGLEALLSSAKTLLLLREDVEVDLDKARNLQTILYLGTHMNATAAKADIVLPVAMWAEYSGTFTNFEGRVQAFHKAVSPPTGILPTWRLLAHLLMELGGAKHQNVQEVFATMASHVDGMQDWSWNSLGDQGRLFPSSSNTDNNSSTDKTPRE